MISLIHPSRGRADKAFQTLTNWSDKCHGEGFDYTLSIDMDDPQSPRYSQLFHGVASYIQCSIGNVVVATNLAAAASEGDILVYLSDDFDCPDGWDTLIEKEFEGVTEPMLLKVDDCLQKFHVPVLTIPIMNRALYEKLGYFWNPLYKSMFVDEDLYWTCHKLNCIKYAPHLKFPHNHVSVGKAQDDETYRRSAANWNQGKEVFARRKAQGFPL